MSVVKVFSLPHPPLAVPDVGKGKEAGIEDTIKAFEKVSADIAEIAPETIIFITPHSTVYSDHFHISPGSKAVGDFSRFGAASTRIETVYDEELINEIANIAEKSGLSAGTQGERDASLDHGTTVPMWFINRRYTNYKSIRISQSGMMQAEHYLIGQIIEVAAERLGRKTVVIGSADLSHKLSDDGPYGYAPQGAQFDALVTEAVRTGDFLSLMNIDESLRDAAGECGYNSLMVIAGIFDCKSISTQVLSYECPFGVGYMVAEFTASGDDDSRNILERFLDSTLEESKKRRDREDYYQNLARRSLEHIIRTGEMLPVPNDLSDELVNNKAGVFVSLHKRGKLRGCIGTIAPTTNCVAQEIIQNAVSAGLRDSRFPSVSEEELDYLSYKVDILMPPEKISSPGELDVKKYGVIVSCGYRRGLLLPNLDGVELVEEQIRIARSKGGIGDDEPVTLERFEVIRHE